MLIMDKPLEKKPKFFCESCGAEVRQNDKFCKHCGKFFASVKCPQCNKIGDAASFSKGCPVCGYAVIPHLKNNVSIDLEQKTGEKEFKRYSSDSLPVWIYLTALILTMGVLIFAVQYLQ